MNRAELSAYRAALARDRVRRCLLAQRAMGQRPSNVDVAAHCRASYTLVCRVRAGLIAEGLLPFARPRHRRADDEPRDPIPIRDPDDEPRGD